MRVEPQEPGQLGVQVVSHQVQMHAVLDHLGLGEELEEHPRPDAVDGLDQDCRVVFWIIDAVGAQPSQLLLVVGSKQVAVQHAGPEPGRDAGCTQSMTLSRSHATAPSSCTWAGQTATEPPAAADARLALVTGTVTGHG